MSDIIPETLQETSSNLPPTDPKAIYLLSSEVQSVPLVGHLELAPVTETVSYEDLKKLSEDAHKLFIEDLQSLETHIKESVAKFKDDENELVRDGRSVLDHVLQLIQRKIAGK